jgi:hypothetical protein
MHRFFWDLRYAPVTAGDTLPQEDDEALGAVPRRTYTVANAPWASPGNYTVRLTANGTTMTQPLTLRLDPRVKTPASGLALLASLSRELYDGAVAAHAAYARARGLSAMLDTVTGPEATALKAQVDSLAPAAPRGGRFGRGGGGGGGGFGRGGAAAAPPTLNGASNALLAAAMAMQGADVTPTATQIAAADRAKAQAATALARWNAIRTKGLADLNAKRRAAGLSVLGGPSR